MSLRHVTLPPGFRVLMWVSVHDPRPDSPLAQLDYQRDREANPNEEDADAATELSDGTPLLIRSYVHTEAFGAYEVNLVTWNGEIPETPLELLIADLDLGQAIVHPAGRPYTHTFIELPPR